MKQLSINNLKKQRDVKLRQIADIGPFIDGSLCRIERSCGNPKCHCATGEKHPAHIITRSVKNRPRSVYVPVSLLDEVKEWDQNYQRLKTLISEIGQLTDQIIRLHVKVNRAAAKNNKT